MAEQAYAYVTLIPVAKGFQREIAKELAGVPDIGQKSGITAGDNFKNGFKDAMKQGPSLAKVASVAFAAVAAAGTAVFALAVKSASDLGESINAVNVAYGEFANDVLALGDGVATRLGLSQVDFNAAAVRFSAFAEDIAQGGGTVSGAIDNLTSRAADFASVYNIEVSEALQVFQSGLAGQSKPLQRFGINLLDSEVQAFAMANGIGEVGRQLTETEKVQARYGLLLESTEKTAGDFANTSDNLANSQRIIQANITDLSATIGQTLLPTIERMSADFKDAISQVQDPTTELGESFEQMIGTLDALGDALSAAFSDFDTAGTLSGILDFVNLLLVGFAQMAFAASDAGKTIGMLLSGDFSGAGRQFSTYLTRYNAFVDGIYAAQDRAVRLAQTRAMNFGEDRRFGDLSPSQANVALVIPPIVASDTDTTAADAAAQVKKRFQDLVRNTKKALIQNRVKYNEAVKDATRDFTRAQARIAVRYDEALTAATTRRDEALAKSLKNYHENVADINERSAKDLASVIQQSMDRLRNAFRSAAQVNVADMFSSDAINRNVGGLLEGLRDKLTGSRKLIANAAELASQGFSQTFIEQVVAAGAEVGNEMAEGILNATPEQQREIKDLFNVIEEEANTGMDALAKTLFEKNGLATDELKKMYDQVLIDQAESLAEQKRRYDEAIADIMVSFEQEVAKAKVARDNALMDAELRLNEALLKANENFLKGLDRIQQAFKEKIHDMRRDVARFRDEIDALNRLINSVQARTSSNITQFRGLIPFADGGLVTGPTPALIGEAGPELVIPLNKVESILGGMGDGKTVNYYAAPNQSIDSEQDLFQAMRRAKVVANW